MFDFQPDDEPKWVDASMSKLYDYFDYHPELGIWPQQIKELEVGGRGGAPIHACALNVHQHAWLHVCHALAPQVALATCAMGTPGRCEFQRSLLCFAPPSSCSFVCTPLRVRASIPILLKPWLRLCFLQDSIALKRASETLDALVAGETVRRDKIVWSLQVGVEAGRPAQAGRQTDRHWQADRLAQADRQAGRQADRQTCRQIGK